MPKWKGIEAYQDARLINAPPDRLGLRPQATSRRQQRTSRKLIIRPSAKPALNAANLKPKQNFNHL